MTMARANDWLLVLDVDRTLLTDDYRLLPSVRDAVQHVRAQGTTVVLATARGPRALDIVLDDLGDVDAAICFGGALTLTGAGGQLERDHSSVDAVLDLGVRARVIEGARALRISLALYGSDRVFVDQLDRHLAREFSHTADRYTVHDLLTVDEDAFKILAISRCDEIDKLAELQHGFSDQVSCAFSHRNYLEIGPPGVSKGAALRRFARSRGFASDRIVAVGDNDNDLSMLSYAGHAIAMGNATDAVKKVAGWITLSNNDGGVARAINAHFSTITRASKAHQEGAVRNVDVS